MKIFSVLAAGLLFFVAGCGDSSQPAGPELLFVQSANYASLRDGRLTLEGLGEVGWFSDRPYREAGRVATRDFIRAWQAGQNSFAENPPNASLVCAIDFEDVDFFVELSDPAFDERMGVLSYGVRAIGDGVLPTAFDCDGGTAHLFIDALRGDET